MVKLKDVAKAAGMSVTQVSRALNDHDDVNEDTKAKIKAIAHEMGYVKNMNAKRLALGTSKQIAFVIKGLNERQNQVESNAIYPLLRGINEYTNQHQYEVVVYILPESIQSYIEFFREKGIREAILYGFKYDDSRFNELINSEYTCVCIDIPVEGENKGCVITNNTFYAAEAVELLIQSGKKNLAMITGSPHAIVSIEREAGYKQALQDNGRDTGVPLIYNGEYEEKIAKSMTLKAMNQHPEIDAFFCASDYMAVGCIEAIKSLGKEVPRDVAVIGFDNMPIAKYVSPKLTTVAQDDYQKGYNAAELMIGIITKTCDNRKIVMNCELKIRESV